MQFERFSCKIEMLAEMSERLKERDWKSRDGGESSGGSNPLLCAKISGTEKSVPLILW